MHNYDYAREWQKLLTPEIVSMLTRIHEYKGGQSLWIKTKADILEKLAETAKIQSIEASNKVGGIYTSDARLKKLVKDKTRPKPGSEEEIAGYRDVLNTIGDSYEHIPPKAPIILQLHRDLYKYKGYNGGNAVLSWEKAEAVEALCQQFEEALDREKIDPLLLIPMFVLDFWCIQPFSDGNGRMSRLLILLLFYRAGYIVGKYISIEQLMEITQNCYYDSLKESSEGWHDNRNDYEPFVKYMLGTVLEAYVEFSARIESLSVSGMSKPERVSKIIENALGTITKAEIMERCPDISLVTVQRTLGELAVSGKVIKLGGGRYTKYTWNRERK